MPLELVPMRKEHLHDAARLAACRYQKLLDQVAILPARYADVGVLASLLNDIVEAGNGIVALEHGQCQGFLAAWRLASFRGRPAVFSPEWANAVAAPHGRQVYEAMYTCLADAWRAEGYHTHLVSLLANDLEGIECWQWLGMGMIAADAVRDLQPVLAGPCQAEIRLAGPQDIEVVVDLADALRRHGAGSPIFLTHEQDREQIRAEYQNLLQDAGAAVWVAYQGSRAVAFLRIGPANDDACTIIYDARTASITGTFTHEDVRGGGIATHLLNQSLAWARARGYERCAVDFEPMNHWARRFWLRYFQPVSYTFIRHIDERA